MSSANVLQVPYAGESTTAFSAQHSDAFRNDIRKITKQISRYWYEISPKDAVKLSEKDIIKITGTDLNPSQIFWDTIAKSFRSTRNDVMEVLNNYVEIYVEQTLRPNPDSAEKLCLAVITTHEALQNLTRSNDDGVDVLLLLHRDIDAKFRQALESRGIALKASTYKSAPSIKEQVMATLNQADFGELPERLSALVNEKSHLNRDDLIQAFRNYQAAYMDFLLTQGGPNGTLDRMLADVKTQAGEEESHVLHLLITIARLDVKKALKEHKIDLPSKIPGKC